MAETFKDFLSIVLSFFRILFLYFIFCLAYLLYQFLIYKTMSKNDFIEPFNFEKDQIRLMLFHIYVLLMPFFLILMPFLNTFLKKPNLLKILFRACINFLLLVLFIKLYFFMEKNYFLSRFSKELHFYAIYPQATPFVKVHLLNITFNHIHVFLKQMQSFDTLMLFWIGVSYVLISQLIVSWIQRFFRNPQELFMFNFVFLCILAPTLYIFIYQKL